MKRVAIQGHFGSFHDQAAQTFYLNKLGYVPQIIECPNFASLYPAMEGGKADAAIMAIENTISGGLLPTSSCCACTNSRSKERFTSRSTRT